MLTVDIEKLPSFKTRKRKTLKLSVKVFHSIGYDVKQISTLLHIREDEVNAYLK